MLLCTYECAVCGGKLNYHFVNAFMSFENNISLVRKVTKLYSVRGLERSEMGGSHGCPERFGTDFYNRSIIRPKHRAYYRSG